MKTLQHFCDCSGGEAQRVWIATVLAQQPDLLFLDEPTAFLDISYQVEVMQLVKKLNRENGMGIVMVLHDLGQALEVSDRVVVIQNGKKYAEGPSEELLARRGLYYALWKKEAGDNAAGKREET
ncbi:ATP-binding cassette domain-containing protein [Acidaminococcus fermentans]|uniref:ATP-binding cassette domain-containing protein n=1 Tax=Acidaminococcus fermentans TaxID=905 RepID=UPI002E77A593|nr:ATP-binding cassette domain-containing protein [Acidaminococcus fermentans]MEE1598460.1 ATP-binding cassette domain-containing protein [Acidaminococcus fermentans]MEE4122722.1 ATP-binding cassette domain-containing protein [Acidaminococcus fermentans]